MKSITRFATSVLLMAALSGCAKKSEEGAADPTASEEQPAAEAAAPDAAQEAPAQDQGKEVLPGAALVRAALERKDYENAVVGLLALRGAAQQSPQAEEYTALYDEVKFALLDASASDPKAAKALMLMRAAVSGR